MAVSQLIPKWQRVTGGCNEQWQSFWLLQVRSHFAYKAILLKECGISVVDMSTDRWQVRQIKGSETGVEALCDKRPSDRTWTAMVPHNIRRVNELTRDIRRITTQINDTAAYPTVKVVSWKLLKSFGISNAESCIRRDNESNVHWKRLLWSSLSTQVRGFKPGRSRQDF